jgi:hypothetical protein
MAVIYVDGNGKDIAAQIIFKTLLDSGIKVLHVPNVKYESVSDCVRQSSIDGFSAVVITIQK